MVNVKVRVKIKTKKSLFLLSLLLFPLFLKPQDDSHIDNIASCIDFAQGGEIELIRVIGKETESIIEDIDIVVDVNNKSVVDTLISVISEREESIIDFSDAQAESLSDAIDQSTEEVFDALNDFFDDINEIARTVIRHNLSKSGQFLTAFIDNPGYYALGSDTLLELTIRADNVTVDLNDFTVSGTAPIITIEPGHKNVEIKNGKIRSFFNSGITIGNSCELVSVEDVKISGDISFSTPGVLFSGVSKDCIFRNCVIQDFETGVEANSGIIKCIFENCSFLNCKKYGFSGIPVWCFFDRCNVIGISNTDIFGRGVGFFLSGTNNVLSECFVLNVSGSGSGASVAEAAALGILVFSKNKIVNCVVNGVTSNGVGTAYGIYVIGSNSVFEGNEVLNSQVGINVSNSDNFLIKNIAYNNVTNYIGPIGNVYLYDHDSGFLPTNRNPFNLDNISIVGP